MSVGSIALAVADSMGMTALAPQPTQQQVARFEQQLQQTSYAAPPAGGGSDFHALVDYFGAASSRLNGNLEPATTQLDLHALPPELQEQVQLQREFHEGLRNMNNATLEFEIIGKSVELAENTPKVLYQQG
jgi:hypothetical protein